MGTREYYVYKWRGRYYIYYNQWDSYPAGLGMKLVEMIPSEPSQYRQWLEQKRAEYTEAEMRLEQALFTVDHTRATNGTNVPWTAVGAENTEEAPNYVVMPKCDMINKQWDTLLDAATLFHTSACRHARLAWEGPDCLILDAETGITSTILPCVAPQDDHISAYSSLSPSLVMPRTYSKLSKRPIATVARCVFDSVLGDFSQVLWRAQYTSSVSDFIFREAAFILLCICSSSPELLRMETRVQQTRDTLSAPFAMLRTSGVGGSSSEFASSAFQGYHLKDNTPGSSPSDPFYWLLGVFVSLNRDLASPQSIRKAVVDVVVNGRRTGTKCFNAVIISISHVILVRVTKDSAQHTKKLRLVDVALSRDEYALERRRQMKPSDNDDTEDESEEYDSESEHDEAQESLPSCQGMTDWVETEQVDTFGALAGLFEATARDSLMRSTSSQGIFPNEIYHQIITYVDPATRIACLTVSRAFRDYASEIFCMSDDLSLVLLPGVEEPRCYHPIDGNLDIFELTKLSNASVSKKVPQWCPVIGHPNGRASFIPQQQLVVGSLVGYGPSLTTVEALPGDEMITNSPHYVRSEEVEQEYDEVCMSFYTHGGSPQDSESAEGGPKFDYTLFERHLPPREVFASSGNIMCLYAAVFFIPLRIFGCIPGWQSAHWRASKPIREIGTIPKNTCAYLASRRNSEAVALLSYGLAWARPPSEDSPSGWDKAIRDATEYATHRFAQYQHQAWLTGQDVNNEDFAIVVMIGRRCRFFHQRSSPVQEYIPNIGTFPAIEKKFSTPQARWQGGYESWEEAGISLDEVLRRTSLRWEPIHEILEKDSIVPLDPLDSDHQPKIGKAFKWIQCLADARGKEGNTSL